MTDFEQHLWSRLQAEGADAVRPRRAAEWTPAHPRVICHRRPLALGGGLTGLAAALIAAVLALTAGGAPAAYAVTSGAGGAPAAYAVTSGAGGTVTVMLRVVHDRAGVNRALAGLGVRARFVPIGRHCPRLGMGARYRLPAARPAVASAAGGAPGAWQARITPARIPAGHTLVFAVERRAHGYLVAAAIVSGHGPHCASALTAMMQQPPAG